MNKARGHEAAPRPTGSTTSTRSHRTSTAGRFAGVVVALSAVVAIGVPMITAPSQAQTVESATVPVQPIPVPVVAAPISTTTIAVVTTTLAPATTVAPAANNAVANVGGVQITNTTTTTGLAKVLGETELAAPAAAGAPAFTGSDVKTPVRVALGLGLLGAALVVGARRRRSN